MPGAMNTSPFGAGSTIAQNALEEKRYIDGVRKAANAQHVDIVAHSMGGLISRYYLQNLMPTAGDSRPMVSHLVMLGTPNEGSACADDLLALQFFWNVATWFGIGGQFPDINQPTLQLTPEQMTGFNKVVTKSRGATFHPCRHRNHGTLSCAGSPGAPNDDVVSRTDAWWSIGDRGELPLYHTAMTSSSEAFSKWVLPRLALGPSAVGGGAYTGPATPSPATRAAPVKGEVVRASVARSYAFARRSSFGKSKTCLARTPTAPVSFGASKSVAPGKSVSIALRVPRRAGALPRDDLDRKLRHHAARRSEGSGCREHLGEFGKSLWPISPADDPNAGGPGPGTSRPARTRARAPRKCWWVRSSLISH